MGRLCQAALRRPRAGVGLPLPLYHRVAISNERLIRLQDGRVTFRWKDYKQPNKQKLMTLEAGSSSGVISYMFYPGASCASGISAGWPIRIVSKSSPCVASCLHQRPSNSGKQPPRMRILPAQPDRRIARHLSGLRQGHNGGDRDHSPNARSVSTTPATDSYDTGGSVLASPIALLHNTPDRSRFARLGSFPISFTDCSFRIRSHFRYWCAQAITFHSSGGPDSQPRGEAAHWNPIQN